jgi:lysine-ketoglutarate reductase/saccharopine dehydrogenase-like protein (TIGR00300 family)
MKKHNKTIIVRGHIIDSLSLSKIFDEIIERGGDYLLEDIDIGKTRTNLSRARIKIIAEKAEILDSILTRLHQLGAEEPEEPPVMLEPAPSDGVFPDDFYVTSNFETEIRHNGKWIKVKNTGMDCGIRVDLAGNTAKCVKMDDVKKDERYVVGLQGVRIRYFEKPGRSDQFAFMDSGVSSERPKRALIAETARMMKRINARKNGKIVVVSGPAVVHTGAGVWLARLINSGYVDLLLTGNALAVHDIEASFFGTSLGVSLKEGTVTFEGHRNHMRAINRIRAAGGIRAAVKQGLLKDGIMHACIQKNCAFILAGSIRDDGPLPEVITDTVKAQKAMKSGLRDAGLVLILATMLHGIAVGNMLPQKVTTVCVDISPAVVTKLADRGSHQTRGLVMDVEAFLHELCDVLEMN